MKTATINIGSKIDIISINSVTTFNMAKFPEEITNFDMFTLNGLAKPAKLAKYKAIAISKGYQLVETKWCNNAGFEGENADVLNFNITFKK